MATQPKTSLSHTEVDNILQQHDLWLKGGHKKGKQADFRDKIIFGYDFSGKTLTLVSFYNASLYNCRFAEAILNDSYFTAAEIVRCDFTKARLDNVDFSWSSVQGSVFTDSTHLTIKSFKRANLKGSVFPSGFSFDGIIAYTDQLIKKARNIFGVALGFGITTLLLLLFGNGPHSAGLITLPLPLISKEVDVNLHVGLLLNFIILTMAGIFYSLSLSAIQKQLDKIPAVFPDGRFAYETVFPWFWVTWIGEMWQTDYKAADIEEKHLLWSRFLVLAGVSNVLFASIFVILLLAFKQCQYLPTLIDYYRTEATSLIAILFIATLSEAYKSRGKSYSYWAGTGALITWGTLYACTDFSYTLLAAFTMIVAWWYDTLIYSNKPFSMDMSVPESNHYSDTIKAMHGYVQPRFDGTNVVFGVVVCFLVSVYLFITKFA